MLHVTKEEEEFWEKLHEGKEYNNPYDDRVSSEVKKAIKKTFFKYHEALKNLRDR